MLKEQKSIFYNSNNRLRQIKKQITELVEEIEEENKTASIQDSLQLLEIANESEKMFQKVKNVLELVNCVTRIEKRNLLIQKYLKHLRELADLNRELFNATEFYEGQNMIDYNHELFNIFKCKVGYYTKLANNIEKLL